VCWLAAGAAALAAPGARAQSIEDLRQMPIEQLSQIQVSSVTKTSEALSEAPAAIYVITHEDIMRSGATNIADILRLAPNLDVIETGASHYIVTARGFSGNTTDQNFANKLLVLIDGRSVYSPLYSGVYWDMQNLVPADIDHIEVISGPGSTLWGANAVNGVVNIITRKASQTQGMLVQGFAGNLQSGASARYGGMIGTALSYRVYGTDTYHESLETPSGTGTHDHWSAPQGGFRIDWTPSPGDAYTLQGDMYRGRDSQADGPDETIIGRNLLGRWTHSWQGGSSLQVQAYYDHFGRSTPGAGSFVGDTYDLDVQHTFELLAHNQITWGGGLRATSYRIESTGALLFAPAARTLDLSNAFVQDSISVLPSTRLIIGLKLEDDPYSGVAWLPSARVAFKPNGNTLVWAAVSRAIRAPTPFDDDVIEKVGATTFLDANTAFQPETLVAYEAGVRAQTTATTSFRLSVFYNVYDDLRSIEPTPTTILPLYWGNLLQGETYGLEAWGGYQATPWWKLAASFEELIEHFRFKPGSSDLLGTAQIGDDPENRASIRSAMNLPHHLTLDATLRYVGVLPDPHLKAYAELNGRVGWNVTDNVVLALSGFNLLHPRHLEFPASEAYAVPRSYSLSLEWNF
jgi:iron complex outermembrane recepter protein